MRRVTSESRIQDILLEDIDRSSNHRLPLLGDAERIETLIRTSLNRLPKPSA